MPPRFFVADDQVAGGRATIVGEDASHLVGSLRARAGEHVIVVDPTGMEYQVVLDELAADRASGTVIATRRAEGEPRLQVHVVQALPKDGMDAVVDALAALGAASIRPCISERTVARPQPARGARRVEHWQRIARGAAQLAGRGRVPSVEGILPIGEACARLPADARILACMVSPETQALCRIDIDPAVPAALLIGPEGDLTERDLDSLGERRHEAVHLGPRVLRSRLAAAAALTVMLGRSGDLDRPVAGWEATG